MTDEQKFIVARWAYSLGVPIISDAEYTQLLDYFKTTKPDWEYVNRSWSSDPCPTEVLNAVGRTDLIKAITLSDKTESIPSLNTWLEVSQTYSSADLTGATISYKHDGWNVQATYYNGELIDVSTRGRSSDALDVSVLKSLYPSKIPAPGRVKVIGECTVSKELFADMQKTYGNVLPRSAVRTALVHPECTARLTIHCFDIIGYKTDTIFPTLIQWGFKTPMWETINTYDELLQQIKRFDSYLPNYSSPTDGLVVAKGVNRRAIRVGAWEEPIYHSYVEGYEESYGPHTISIKVLIHPVHTSKGMQYRIPMTNLARVVDYCLKPGSPIAFNTVSGAIADFNEEATRLLHLTWAGKYLDFQQKVNREEEAYDNMANTR